MIRWYRSSLFLLALMLAYWLAHRLNLLLGWPFLLLILALIWTGPAQALYRADGVMPRSHKAVISVLVLLLIAFQVVTAGLDEMNVPRVGANGLPACDSAFMKTKTVEALNNGPDARVSGLQAYDVVNASPSPVDLTAGGKEIGCVMNVTTNAGLRPVIAVFTWQDAARSKWFIQTVGGL